MAYPLVPDCGRGPEATVREVRTVLYDPVLHPRPAKSAGGRRCAFSMRTLDHAIAPALAIEHNRVRIQHCSLAAARR